eukprot:12937192-Prorocentrum_lima.AAC.1
MTMRHWPVNTVTSTRLGQRCTEPGKYYWPYQSDKIHITQRQVHAKRDGPGAKSHLISPKRQDL